MAEKYGVVEVKNVSSSEREKAHSLAYYYANREEISAKRKVYRRSITAKGYDKEWRLKRKERVLLHYSGKGAMFASCIRCGVNDIRALSIDHINGGGTQARKTNPQLRGKSVYLYLIQMGFPEGYQTLCMNCQFIKRYENGEATSWPKPGSGGKKREVK